MGHIFLPLEVDDAGYHRHSDGDGGDYEEQNCRWGEEVEVDGEIDVNGCLDVSALAVYDLPWDDTPTILVSACGQTVKAGPPISRNRKRNSFRFTRNSSSSSNLADFGGEESLRDRIDTPGCGTTTPSTSNAATAKMIVPSSSSPMSAPPIQLVAPLKDLFRCTAQIRVIYPQKKNNNSQQYLECYVDLRENLRINESKWLIAQLKSSATLSLHTTELVSHNAQEGDIPQVNVMPTIRMRLLLHGPYRPEIASLIRLSEAYFHVVDTTQRQIQHLLRTLRFDEYGKFLLLPIIPVVVGVLVVSPLLAGVFMVGLPFFLPLVLIGVWIVVCLAIMVTILIASTKQGRSLWFHYLTHFVDTSLGQRIVYETGPRPTVVSMLKRVVPTSRRPTNIYDDDIDFSCDPMTQIWSKLILSLLIDSIGSASYMLPVVGEVLDVVYAPLQTVMIMAMYDYVCWPLQYLSFIEEILFWTDVVPSATIGWLVEYVPLLIYPTDKDGTFIIEQVVSDLTLTDHEDDE